MQKKKSERPLDRFPYSEVGVSYFAEQAYCEKRVELWLDNPTASGLVSVPAAFEGLPEAQCQEDLVTSGKEFHEAVERVSTPLSSAEIAQAVQLGHSFALSESRLTGEHKGVRLRGRPDHVFFDGQQASCVLEYKVTDSNQLQTSHRVQLLLYGYLLGQQNFNVDHLILVCVLVPRHHETWLAKLTPSRVHKFVTTIRTEAESLIAARPSRKNWHQMRVEVSRDVHVTLRVFRYDPKRAKRELDFFTAYWLGGRDAVGTRKESKCAVCQYNRLKLCPVPQVEYGG
jgi:CRISPR/Cas system-associated exonuclease Cas4 (RecB family)